MKAKHDKDERERLERKERKRAKKLRRQAARIEKAWLKTQRRAAKQASKERGRGRHRAD